MALKTREVQLSENYMPMMWMLPDLTVADLVEKFEYLCCGDDVDEDFYVSILANRQLYREYRLSKDRLPRLRKMISLLSNLGNSQYELTDEQSHKIIRILKSDITMLENKLLNRKSEVKSFNVKL